MHTRKMHPHLHAHLHPHQLLSPFLAVVLEERTTAIMTKAALTAISKRPSKTPSTAAPAAFPPGRRGHGGSSSATSPPGAGANGALAAVTGCTMVGSVGFPPAEGTSPGLPAGGPGTSVILLV